MTTTATNPHRNLPVSQVFWTSCDPMMLIDEHRQILVVNPALERLVGLPAKTIVGHLSCGELFRCQNFSNCPIANRPELCPAVRAMEHFEPVAGAEYIVHPAHGVEIVVNVSYTPVQPDPAGPVLALAVIRDVTHRKQHEWQLEHEASTDALTGLINHARFLKTGQQELRRAARYGHRLAIGMADLDHFKAYNDRYGHPAGSEILRDIAKALQSVCRSSEIVSRYGGDEFAFLLPETDGVGAAAVAERLRIVVENCSNRAPMLRGTASSLTMSVGVALFPDDADTVKELLEYADQRLYEAKHRGGNCVVSPGQLLEKRRSPRSQMVAPIAIQLLDSEQKLYLDHCVARDWSSGGLYCYATLPSNASITIGQSVSVSMPVPTEWQTHLGSSGWIRRGRVLRLNSQVRASGEAPGRIGLAVQLDGPSQSMGDNGSLTTPVIRKPK